MHEWVQLEIKICFSYSGPAERLEIKWGTIAPPPQFLANHLDLFQTGGLIMPTTLLLPPPSPRFLIGVASLPKSILKYYSDIF